MTDESDDQCAASCDDYLHPEILSTEVLISILKERKIKINEMDTLDKCKLVKIFDDHILPHSQRIYGEGRRAKRLARSRQLREAENAKNSNETNETGADSNHSTVGLQISKGDSRLKSTNNDRLKPPPDSTSHKKIIKLNSNTESDTPEHLNSNKTDCKRKMTEKLQQSDQAPKKQKHPPITW